MQNKQQQTKVQKNRDETEENILKCGMTKLAPHHTDSLKTKAPNTTGSNHLYITLELLMMGIMVPETC